MQWNREDYEERCSSEINCSLLRNDAQRAVGGLQGRIGEGKSGFRQRERRAAQMDSTRRTRARKIA